MDLKLAPTFGLSLVVTLVASLAVEVFVKMDIHPSQIGEEFVVHQGWGPAVSCNIYQETSGKLHHFPQRTMDSSAKVSFTG